MTHLAIGTASAHIANMPEKYPGDLSLPVTGEELMPKGRTIEVFVGKKRDEKMIRALAKHLNQGTAGQRAARTKRKRGSKK